MSACPFVDTPDIELYFYDELDASARAGVGAHLPRCAACRQRLDDLDAIRAALAAEPLVDAPPAGDWSGFMRRLDAAVGSGPARVSPAVVLERGRGGWTARHLAVIAATLALVTLGVFMAARARAARPANTIAAANLTTPAPAVQSASGLSPAAALREVSAE